VFCSANIGCWSDRTSRPIGRQGDRCRNTSRPTVHETACRNEWVWPLCSAVNI